MAKLLEKNQEGLIMYHLLKPLQAGSLTLSNRLVMPPMATAKAEPDGKVSEVLLDYYREKSQGGYIALIIIEHSYIMPEGKAGANQLSVADDSVIPGLKQLAALIHSQGSKAVMQINHAGSNTTSEIIGETPMGPSPIANPRREETPQELSPDDIRKIIKAFRDAAIRVKQAGFDGVEIHSAHGYLLNQFLSPVTNKRTDEYGGDILNRIRLHLEVIKEIKEAMGHDFPILVRLGAGDFMPGGISVADIKTAARCLEEAGVTIIDVSGGIRGWNIPGLTIPVFFAPLSAAIKSVVNIPVIVTGGITDAETAEQVLADGQADLVGVGRAILRDSQWAKNAVNREVN
jgi:NADPH2 dehydrogenase